MLQIIAERITNVLAEIPRGAMVIIIIQFNSILYYLCAESTATRPITDTAQYRYT
jgi:hypothetical protein